MHTHTDFSLVGRIKPWEAVINKSVKTVVVLSWFVVRIVGWLVPTLCKKKSNLAIYIMYSINSIANFQWKLKDFFDGEIFFWLLLNVNPVCPGSGNFSKVTCFLAEMFGAVACELLWLCGHACPLRLGWDFMWLIIFLFCYFQFGAPEQNFQTENQTPQMLIFQG